MDGRLGKVWRGREAVGLGVGVLMDERGRCGGGWEVCMCVGAELLAHLLGCRLTASKPVMEHSCAARSRNISE
jgi:hypothetical protein